VSQFIIGWACSIISLLIGFAMGKSFESGDEE
jgi:hypothetical protein